MARPSPETLSCIDASLTCYGLCLGMATDRGLAKGGGAGLACAAACARMA